jgi:hypothetical protein
LALAPANNGGILTRNNIRLTLEGARSILAAAEVKARAISVPQNIAVVDPLALGPRISDTCTNPLGDQAALQFGHGAKHRENHLAGGRASVDLL